jgi:hypothetical protein
MGTMLDVIGSIVIRGAIMLAVLNLTIQMNSALYQKTALAAARQATVIPAQIMYGDIYLAGYNDPTKMFGKAKPNEIVFYADIDTNGVADTVHYYLGSGSSANILYRQVSSINSNRAALIAHNVISMTFDYYNIDGSSATQSSTVNVGGVKSIKLKLTIQTDDNSGSTFWEKNIFPPNL